MPPQQLPPKYGRSIFVLRHESRYTLLPYLEASKDAKRISNRMSTNHRGEGNDKIGYCNRKPNNRWNSISSDLVQSFLFHTTEEFLRVILWKVWKSGKHGNSSCRYWGFHALCGLYFSKAAELKEKMTLERKQKDILTRSNNSRFLSLNLARD